MRQMCLNMVYELAIKDPRIFFVGSDLGVGTLDRFKEEMPRRFLMEGISEANYRSGTRRQDTICKHHCHLHHSPVL